MRLIAAASREVARLQLLLRIRVMLCELFGRFYSPQPPTRTEPSASTRGILTKSVTFSHRAGPRHQSRLNFSPIRKPYESRPSNLTSNYRDIPIPNLYSVPAAFAAFLCSGSQRGHESVAILSEYKAVGEADAGKDAGACSPDTEERAPSALERRRVSIAGTGTHDRGIQPCAFRLL